MGISNPRTRRMILLTAYRQFTRVIGIIPKARIPASDTRGWNPILGEARKDSFRQALELKGKNDERGFQIRYRRLQGGLTQGELAKKLGVTRTYISDLEHGRRRAGANLNIKLDSVLPRV